MRTTLVVAEYDVGPTRLWPAQRQHGDRARGEEDVAGESTTLLYLSPNSTLDAAHTNNWRSRAIEVAP